MDDKSTLKDGQTSGNGKSPSLDGLTPVDEDKITVKDDIPSLATESPVQETTPSMPANLETEELQHDDGLAIPPQEESEKAPEPSEATPEKKDSEPDAPASAGSSKKAKMAVVLVIAMILIAAAVYYFVIKKDSSTTTTKTQNTTASQATAADEVTSAGNDIDGALAEVNDTKDFASTDLADASLGL